MIETALGGVNRAVKSALARALLNSTRPRLLSLQWKRWTDDTVTIGNREAH